MRNVSRMSNDARISRFRDAAMKRRYKHEMKSFNATVKCNLSLNRRTAKETRKGRNYEERRMKTKVKISRSLETLSKGGNFAPEVRRERLRAESQMRKRGIFVTAARQIPDLFKPPNTWRP